LEFFKERQVSVENLAQYFHTDLAEGLKKENFSLESVIEFQIKNWESETAWAAYIHA